MWQTKGFKCNEFECVANARVTRRFFGSVAGKELEEVARKEGVEGRRRRVGRWGK
jgi:hypothetical protein